jgi:hypothetical protein
MSANFDCGYMALHCSTYLLFFPSKFIKHIMKKKTHQNLLQNKLSWSDLWLANLFHCWMLNDIFNCDDVGTGTSHATRPKWLILLSEITVFLSLGNLGSPLATIGDNNECYHMIVWLPSTCTICVVTTKVWQVGHLPLPSILDIGFSEIWK